MIIIPTMDILDSTVVLMKKHVPQPLKSILVNNADPLSVLHAFQEKLGCNTFYITDLNARHREGDNFKIINKMSKIEGVSLLVDVGVDTVESARGLMEMVSTKAVVGTKHLRSIKKAQEIIEVIGPSNMMFTVEMEQYRVYANSAEIREMDPIELIRYLRVSGLDDFIVYELSNIGSTGGITADLFDFLCRVFEECRGGRIITGGGIRDIRDVADLKSLGVWGCLIGTALHNGAITAKDILAL